MIELLQFLFVTDRDKNLYFDKNALISELVTRYAFKLREIKEVLDWFEPILKHSYQVIATTSTFRQLACWEQKRVPKDIINKIIHYQQEKLINSYEREILLDRLSALNFAGFATLEEAQDILDGLIFHLKNYGYKHFEDDNLAVNHYNPGNFTVH